MPLEIAPDAPLPGIEHIVVVMLENRSFDNVLGNRYPSSDTFDGIPPDATNSYKTLLGTEHTVQVTTTPPSGNSIFITPNPDPGESQKDMAEQIFQGSPVPTMEGFAQSYYDAHAIEGTPGDILCYFDSTVPDLPVTFALSSCALSDQWFASGPVQTFPNRMFSLCATPGQFGNSAAINDADYLFKGEGYMGCLGTVTAMTVLQQLDDAAGDTSPNPANWKVYFHDVPLSAVSNYVYDAWEACSPCVSSYDGGDYDPPYGTTFEQDVLSGNLPAFAIIEPRYWGDYSTNGTIANSNHPGNDSWYDGGLTGNPIDAQNGEDLLADIVATLLTNQALAESTLLIVLYDEHGGVYDHVPPPPAKTPFPESVDNANVYATFGVRVPAFFFGPGIAFGSVYRPPSGAYPFDHTSIIATLRAQFSLAGWLTTRDENAPILAGLVSSSNAPFEASKVAPPQRERFRAKPSPGPRIPMEEHQRRVAQWVAAKSAPRR